MVKCDHNQNDLTPNDVSKILNRNYRTILAWTKKGVFPNAYVCEKCGTNLIPSNDVRSYIDSMRSVV